MCIPLRSWDNHGGIAPLNGCRSLFYYVIVTRYHQLNVACELHTGVAPKRRNDNCIPKLLSDCPMAIRAPLRFITKQLVYPRCKIICECPEVFCSVFEFVVFWLRGYSILSAEEIGLMEIIICIVLYQFTNVVNGYCNLQN